MNENLVNHLRRALTRLTRIVETAQAGGANESDREMRRLRALEDLIKEQMPYEDVGSSTRSTR